MAQITSVETLLTRRVNGKEYKLVRKTQRYEHAGGTYTEPLYIYGTDDDLPDMIWFTRDKVLEELKDYIYTLHLMNDPLCSDELHACWDIMQYIKDSEPSGKIYETKRRRRRKHTGGTRT